MVHIGIQYAVKGYNNSGEGLVQVYVNFTRTLRKVISTGVYVDPKYWDNKKCKVVKHPMSSNLNDQIYNLKHRIEKFYYESLQHDLHFTPASVHSFLNDIKSVEIFNEFYENELNAAPIAPGTHKDQTKTLKHLNEFCPKLRFCDLDINIIRKFDRYLKGIGHSNTTVFSHHKNVKKYINIAITKGYLSDQITKHPYAAFTQSRPKSERGFLSWEDIMQVYKTEYPTNRLRRVADRFVFACCTGLRVSDLSRVTPDKFDGMMLSMKPVKTSRTSGIAVNLPIRSMFDGLPFEILSKYDLTLPAFSDPDYNSLLKVVASLAGVPPLTSHMARHSFLTMIALITGNLFTVMKLGGIASTDTAMIYVHMAEDFTGKVFKNINWPGLK